MGNIAREKNEGIKEWCLRRVKDGRSTDVTFGMLAVICPLLPLLPKVTEGEIDRFLESVCEVTGPYIMMSHLERFIESHPEASESKPIANAIHTALRRLLEWQV